MGRVEGGTKREREGGNEEGGLAEKQKWAENEGVFKEICML